MGREADITLLRRALREAGVGDFEDLLSAAEIYLWTRGNAGVSTASPLLSLLWDCGASWLKKSAQSLLGGIGGAALPAFGEGRTAAVFLLDSSSENVIAVSARAWRALAELPQLQERHAVVAEKSIATSFRNHLDGAACDSISLLPATPLRPRESWATLRCALAALKPLRPDVSWQAYTVFLFYFLRMMEASAERLVATAVARNRHTVFVSGSDFHFLSRLVALKARPYDNVTTIALTHGAITTPDVMLPIESDYFGVWSQEQKDRLLRHGGCDHRIVVLGNPNRPA